MRDRHCSDKSGVSRVDVKVYNRGGGGGNFVLPGWFVAPNPENIEPYVGQRRGDTGAAAAGF
jgi:hypothetical protein